MKVYEINHSRLFEKNFRELPSKIQILAIEKIALFEKEPNNPLLKNHKLIGKLKGYSAFSVNLSYRIIFTYEDSQTVTLINIGTHSIYK